MICNNNNNCPRRPQRSQKKPKRLSGGPRGRRLPAATMDPLAPNLPTKIIPTQIASLKLSGKSPMDNSIPTL